jgi:hypothetical protein
VCLIVSRTDIDLLVAHAFLQPLDQAGMDTIVVAKRGNVKFGG